MNCGAFLSFHFHDTSSHFNVRRRILHPLILLNSRLYSIHLSYSVNLYVFGWSLFISYFSKRLLQSITNYLACVNGPLGDKNASYKRYNTYIKFRTPDDVTSRNTISVTFNPGNMQAYISSTTWSSYCTLWIGIGENLYYHPNDHSDKNFPSVALSSGSGYIGLAPSTDQW